MDVAQVVLGAFVFWVLSGVSIVLANLSVIRNAIREPVLRHPVLIIESDDWGPGPKRHAGLLRRLTETLAGIRDRRGRCPVVTLGMVLAEPEREEMEREEFRSYRRRTLSHPHRAEVLAAVMEGAKNGIFSLQLHGLEHFWPPALVAAARDDQRVRDWFRTRDPGDTEGLPPPLQSRWIDGTRLPARPLPDGDARDAAAEEARLFRTIFGQIPRVAVPPTFVWTRAVEEGWAAEGVTVVVTPGRRYETRDGWGKVVPTGPPIANGDRSPSGVLYLVRDAYFEPTKGHTAQRGLDAMEERTRLGRPTLLEMHRFNFTGEEEGADRTFRELTLLLEGALRRFPRLAFLSSEELAHRLAERGPEWVEHRIAPRLIVWLRRLVRHHRLRKLAWLTGWALPAAALAFVLERALREDHRPPTEARAT